MKKSQLALYTRVFLTSFFFLFLSTFKLEIYAKVHIFWEGHKILRNIHLTFDWHNLGQKWNGDFAQFCGLLRMNFTKQERQRQRIWHKFLQQFWISGLACAQTVFYPVYFRFSWLNSRAHARFMRFFSSICHSIRTY